jgi:putative membrane protein
MSRTEFTASTGSTPRLAAADAAVYAAIAIAAVLLNWLTRAHISFLPAIAPWEFSFVEFGSAWLFAYWYARGLMRTPPDERPARWRSFSFFGGIALVYAVLETRFEYLAEHQFFFNRMQNVAMHDVGPFLIALSWPGATLAHGMPQRLVGLVKHRSVLGLLGVLQQPVIAGVLFTGLVLLWLIPPLHFRAMIDLRLYAAMNWSMAADGILFWCLVLDPRPSPPAPLPFLLRIALAGLVMIPLGFAGAIIALAQTDLYPYYGLCGRIYPALGPLYDQALGGLVIWIPSTMMSILGVLLVLNALRRSEASIGIRPGRAVPSR